VASTAIALGAGVDDARYLSVLREALPPVFAAFRPGLVVYLAGTDLAHDDAMGNWRLSDAALMVRDRLVTELARSQPMAIVLAGGYGRRAWRHSARFLLWLGSGRPLEPLDDEELTLARLRRSGVFHAAGEPPGGHAFSLTEEDLAALRPAYSHAARFLGSFSRQDVELQLETVGFLPQIRAKGYRRLRLELAGPEGLGDTVKVVCEDDRPEELLAEVRARRSRVTVPGFEVLAIEWLLLQDPRAQFSPLRPRLPGQQHPGLGLLADILGWLVLACEEHALDGIFFVAAHYHVAIQSRRLLRFLDAEDEARVRALVAALEGLSLAEAARAVSEGRVVSAGDGTRFDWKPAACVLPVTVRLRERVSGAVYEAAVDGASARLDLAARPSSRRVPGPSSSPPP
jgi:hypothetical protein